MTTNVAICQGVWLVWLLGDLRRRAVVRDRRRRPEGREVNESQLKFLVGT
jgi:hypothetical protein